MTDPRFHPLEATFLLPERFTYPFCYEPHPLARRAAEGLMLRLPQLEEGKMFGTLVVTTAEGEVGCLWAYSGQTDAFRSGPLSEEEFVPPVYDYLQPDGYFKTHEAEISAINARIASLENSDDYRSTKALLEAKTDEFIAETTRYRALMAEAKSRRDELRQSGCLSEEEEKKLIGESQFQKAELRRMKKRWQASLDLLSERLAAHERDISRMKEERKQRSDSLQRWLFDSFMIADSHGQQRSLTAIFSDFNGTQPPSGAGECCEPKLLHYAFTRGWKPITMAMFWWGDSPKGEVRHHAHYYGACQRKCKPLLTWMLRDVPMDPNPLEKISMKALKIVYEDDNIAVVNKPEGWLTIPGKGNMPSVYSVLHEEWPAVDSPIIVHRLDMDTSGLLVVAKTRAAHRRLSQQFERRETEKTYVALLERRPQPEKGVIDLPLRKDLDDSPRQMVDRENGKPSLTAYEVIGDSNGFTRVLLYPKTGRTHQLRVHCSHRQGLGCPIVGDRLYGHAAARLYLHAMRLTFSHPTTGERMTFEQQPDF